MRREKYRAAPTMNGMTKGKIEYGIRQSKTVKERKREYTAQQYTRHALHQTPIHADCVTFVRIEFEI